MGNRGATPVSAGGDGVEFSAPAASRRLLAVLGLFGLLTLALLADHAGLLATPSGTVVQAGRAAAPAPSLELLAASRGLGASERSYWPTRTAGGGLGARVTGGPLHALFSRRGVRISAPAGSASFALTSLARGAREVELAAAAPQAHANVVSFRHGRGTVEWYANGPLGLEQGASLSRRPLGAARADSLTLGYALSGSLRRELLGGTLTFVTARGAPVLKWIGLRVSDARGRVLPSGVTLHGSRLAIRIDDRGALYPVTVDPLMQSATLTASDAVKGDGFGFSVAQSGSILAVGAPTSGASSSTPLGAVYVFVKPASGWANARQTAKLTAFGGQNGELLGETVAVSGTTVLAGAPGATVGSNFAQGAVFVFNQPAGGWRSETQSGELTASGGQADESLGTSLVANATTVFAGAPVANGQVGKVYLFNKPASGWGNGSQSGVLTSSDQNVIYFGDSLGLSGATLAVGAPFTTVGSNSDQGAVYEFTAPSAGWTTATQTARLVSSNGKPNDELGKSVAVGGNGATIAAGAPGRTVGANAFQGAANVFTEPAGGWTSGSQSATLTASDGKQSDTLGVSVAVSAGASIVYAGTGDGHGLYEFDEAAGGWSDVSTTPDQLGSADASAFSLSVSGADVIEGADEGTGNQVNVFSGPSAPVNTAAPTVTGTATQGQTLTETHGSWTASPTAYTYQWQDCDSAGNNCSAIPGAKSQSYKLAAGDVGHTIRAQEDAANADGLGAPASSIATSVVQSSTGTVTVGHAKVSKTVARVKVSCHGGSGAICMVKLALSVVETSRGGKLIAVSAKAKKSKSKKKKKKTVTLSSATLTLAAGSSRTVALSLNRTGKRLLSSRHRLTAKLTITASAQKIPSQTVTFKTKAKNKPKKKKKRKH